MKTAGLILILFVAATASAQTNQGWSVCRQPVRIFGDHSTVNLKPLFQWWQRQPVSSKADTNAEAGAAADRPLSAWHHLTGIKAGELETSWLVDAVIYTSPTARTSARIILNHPPTTEEQTFNTLKAQLAQARQQITNDQRLYKADLKAAQRAEEQAASYRRSGDKHATESSNNYLRLAAQKREAATTAQNEQKQLEAALPQIQQQLAAIPSKSGRYLVDWFALELGRSKQGMPIYDLGVVPPNSL
jgi:hypothetical protein